MWLLRTMGCGRSKSASSNTGGGGAADTDNSDFYQKAPTGEGKKDSINASDDERQVKKTNSSQGDNNHRIKGQHTNGEVKSSKDSKDSHDKPSSGPLAPNAPPEIEEPSRRSEVNPAQKNITDSQIEFFRMLDEKIEKGRDYDGISQK